jgi:hypothetical protein
MRARNMDEGSIDDSLKRRGSSNPETQYFEMPVVLDIGGQPNMEG